MKALKLALVAMVVGALTLGIAGTAGAASTDDCAHDATVASLHECITHGQALGHISPVIAARLHDYLSQADTALARGQEGVAVNWLRNVVLLINASAPRGLIEPHMAQHLIEHVDMVIGGILGLAS